MNVVDDMLTAGKPRERPSDYIDDPEALEKMLRKYLRDNRAEHDYNITDIEFFIGELNVIAMTLRAWVKQNGSRKNK